MNITEVKIRQKFDTGRMRAIVSIVIDDELAVHDLKIIKGDDRNFLAMPSRKEPDGTFRDVVHPLSSKLREEIENYVLKIYEEDIHH